MYIYSNYNSGRGGSNLGCLIMGVFVVAAIYFILKGLFKLLYYVSPVLFILALIISWRSVVDTGKDFLKMLERNPVGGLFLAFIAVIGYPVLSLFLFVKALGYNKLEKMKQQMGGYDGSSREPADDFVEFEEIESKPKDTSRPAEEPLQAPPAPQKKPEPAPEKPANPYEDMFDR